MKNSKIKIKKWYNSLNNLCKKHPLLANIIGGLIVTFFLAILSIFFGNDLINFLLEKIIKSFYWRTFFIILFYCFIFSLVISIFSFFIVIDRKSLKQQIRVFEKEASKYDQFGIVQILENNKEESLISENYNEIR